MRKNRWANRPKFPRGSFWPLPAPETPQVAHERLRREKKLLANDALREKEFRRIAEVQAAFFEGMIAGQDAFWHERPPEHYWLESGARQHLFAGPPLPASPEARARLGRYHRGYNYKAFCDPSRVFIADARR